MTAFYDAALVGLHCKDPRVATICDDRFPVCADNRGICTGQLATGDDTDPELRQTARLLYPARWDASAGCLVSPAADDMYNPLPWDALVPYLLPTAAELASC